MAYAFPSATNTFVPSHEASGALVLGYSKNMNKFAVNRYVQMIPVQKSIFYLLNWNSENAARITTSLGQNFVWPDAADAPVGQGNTESFEYQIEETTRYAFPFILGQKGVQQADWNILSAHAGMSAQQAMTHRTLLANYAIANSGATSATATSLGGGKFNVGTPTNPYLKDGLYKAAAAINIATIGVVQVSDLAIVLNPNTSYKIGASQEITDNMKYVNGVKYVVGGNATESSRNYTQWGIPSELYGFETIVDDTVVTTAGKGVAVNPAYVIPDGTIYMVSKAGGLEGVEGAASWSSVQMYAYEDLTVETMNDVNNRNIKGRVITDFTVQIPDQGVKSISIITSCV